MAGLQAPWGMDDEGAKDETVAPRFAGHLSVGAAHCLPR